MNEQRYSETEEAIFRAAIQEFGKNGKAGARMKAIAEGAGVNKALVHYYFRDKEHLYDAVFDFVFNYFMETLIVAVKDTRTFDEALWALIDGYTDFLLRYNQYPLLLQQEFDTGGQTWRKKYEQVRERYNMTAFTVFRDRMNEEIGKGKIREIDPLQTYMDVMGSCAYTFIAYPILQCIRPNLDEHKCEFIEQRKRHIYDLIRTSLNARYTNE